MVDLPRGKRKEFKRRIREEAVYINGARVEFFRCARKRRWTWRVIDGKVRPAKRV